MRDPKRMARDAINEHRDQLLDLSREIHASPELGWQEHRAVEAIAGVVRHAGLPVEIGTHDLPTAFKSEVGDGPITIAICAEYDALPDVGHACGHNLIAASSVGAAIGLAPVSRDLGLRVRLLGTPAEEVGDSSGKILMLERGAFSDVDLAMMVHPAPFDIARPRMIAAASMTAGYVGKEAHAAFYPELGINAADAMLVAQTALAAMRQQMRPTDRLHGIVTHGGSAPNIIPARTTARYMARCDKLDDLQALRDRVIRCFEAGALATGCTLNLTGGSKPYADVHHDLAGSESYQRNAEALGLVFPTDPAIIDRPSGSTDMGNVSHAVRSIHPFIGIDSYPAVNHQPEFAHACLGEAADRALIDAAVAMAWTAIDFAQADMAVN